MTTILTILITIIILSFLVFIHEFGHFAAAKLMKVTVKEFSVGFGKSLFSKTYKGTKYKIGAIPLGGYVQLEGEAKNTGPNSFRAKSYPAKLFILMAGVLMNLLFSIIIFSFFLMFTGYQFALPQFSNFKFTNVDTVQTYFPVTVFDIDQNSVTGEYLEDDDTIVGINGMQFESIDEFDELVAENEGQEISVEFIDLETFDTYVKDVIFEEYDQAPLIITLIGDSSPLRDKVELGDRLISIDDQVLESVDELNAVLEENEGEEVPVVIEDVDGEQRTELITVELLEINENDVRIYLNLGLSQYTYGFAASYDTQTNRETYFIEYNKNIFAGTALTYDIFRYQFVAIATLFDEANETGDYTEVADSVGGVPQLGDQVGQVIEFEAFLFLIPLSALLSLALATFNALPFPALDGGQATVATIEFITRRNIPDPILNAINLFGFVVLIILALAVTVKDIVQLGWLDGII